MTKEKKERKPPMYAVIPGNAIKGGVASRDEAIKLAREMVSAAVDGEGGASDARVVRLLDHVASEFVPPTVKITVD